MRGGESKEEIGVENENRENERSNVGVTGATTKVDPAHEGEVLTT